MKCPKCDHEFEPAVAKPVDLTCLCHKLTFKDEGALRSHLALVQVQVLNITAKLDGAKK